MLIFQGVYGPVCLGSLKMQPTCNIQEKILQQTGGEVFSPRCYQTAELNRGNLWSPQSNVQDDDLGIHTAAVFFLSFSIYLDPRWHSPGVWWCRPQNAAWAETTEAWRIVPFCHSFWCIIKTCVQPLVPLCFHSSENSGAGANCQRVCK